MFFALAFLLSASAARANPYVLLEENSTTTYHANGTAVSTESLGRAYIFTGSSADTMQFVRVNLSGTAGTDLLSRQSFVDVASSPSGGATSLYFETSESTADTEYSVSSVNDYISLSYSYVNARGGTDLTDSANNTLLFNFTLVPTFSSSGKFYLQVPKDVINDSGDMYDALELSSPGSSAGSASVSDTDSDGMADRISWSGSFSDSEPLYVWVYGDAVSGRNFNSTLLSLNCWSSGGVLAESPQASALSGISIESESSHGAVSQGIDLVVQQNVLVRGYLENSADDTSYNVSGWELYRVGESDPLDTSFDSSILAPGERYWTGWYTTNDTAKQHYYSYAYDWGVVWNSSQVRGNIISGLEPLTVRSMSVAATKEMETLYTGVLFTRVGVTDTLKHVGHTGVSVGNVTFSSDVGGWVMSDYGIYFENDTYSKEITDDFNDSINSVTRYPLTAGLKGRIDVSIGDVSLLVGRNMTTNDRIVLKYNVTKLILSDVYITSTLDYELYSGSGTASTGSVEESVLATAFLSSAEEPSGAAAAGGGGGADSVSEYYETFEDAEEEIEKDVKGEPLLKKVARAIGKEFLPESIDKAIRESAVVAKHFSGTRTLVRSVSESSVSLSFRISPDAGMFGSVHIFDEIPKTLAENIDDIEIVTDGSYTVVNPDPSVVFHFTPEQLADGAFYSYSVKKDVDGSVIKEFGKPDAFVLGESLVKDSLETVFSEAREVAPGLVNVTFEVKAKADVMRLDGLNVTLRVPEGVSFGKDDVVVRFFDALAGRWESLPEDGYVMERHGVEEDIVGGGMYDVYLLVGPEEALWSLEELDRIHISYEVVLPQGTHHLVSRVEVEESEREYIASEEIYLPIRVSLDVLGALPVNVALSDAFHAPVEIGAQVKWYVPVEARNPNGFGIAHPFRVPVPDDTVVAWVVRDGERREIRLIKSDRVYAVWEEDIPPGETVSMFLQYDTLPVSVIFDSFFVLGTNETLVEFLNEYVIANPSDTSYEDVSFTIPQDIWRVTEVLVDGRPIEAIELGGGSMVVVPVVNSKKTVKVSVFSWDVPPVVNVAVDKESYGCGATATSSVSIIAAEDVNDAFVETEVVPRGLNDVAYAEIHELSSMSAGERLLVSDSIDTSSFPTASYDVHVRFRRGFRTIEHEIKSFDVICEREYQELADSLMILALLLAALYVYGRIREEKSILPVTVKGLIGGRFRPIVFTMDGSPAENAALVEGWWPMESGFRWAGNDRKHAKAVVAVEPGYDYSLCLDLFFPKQLKGETFDLFVNGARLARRKIKNEGSMPVSVKVPAALVSDGHLTVVMSSKFWKRKGDGRWFSFAVDRLRLDLL